MLHRRTRLLKPILLLLFEAIINIIIIIIIIIDQINLDNVSGMPLSFNVRKRSFLKKQFVRPEDPVEGQASMELRVFWLRLKRLKGWGKAGRLKG